MFKRHRTILFLITCLFFLSLSHLCFAQKQDGANRASSAQLHFINRRRVLAKRRYHFKEEIHMATPKDRIRAYDMVLEFGFGNFAYDKFGGNGSSDGQSVYIGNMASVKPTLRVIEKKGIWAIEISGEIFGTAYGLERWWSEQELSRINKLMAQGFCMETLIRYHFDEKALYPFPVLAQTNIGLGFIYRFHALRRKDESKPIDIPDEPPLPKETDFALFGIEPNLGFNFKMDDGRITGYLDIGTGIYGASIEDNYESTGILASPERTFGRSILARIGIRGTKGRINYQIGYSVFRLKIKAKDTIPESRTKLDKIVCYLGMKF